MNRNKPVENALANARADQHRTETEWFVECKDVTP